MTLPGLYRYLYGLAAACFLGLGSGFVTLAPYLIDRETEMMRVGSAYEQVTGIEFDEGFNCDLGRGHYAECKVADYMVASTSTLVTFYERLAYILFFVGSFSLGGGVYHHHKESKNVRAT